MTEQTPEITLLYKRLDHIMKELQIVRRELARFAPHPELATDIAPTEQLSWETLHEEGLRLREENGESNYDFTQTPAWQLCGAFRVREPDPEFIVGYDEQGEPITNYAEHIDEVLYS